jgi:aldehyde:ferredoxin oxidoreductase
MLSDSPPSVPGYHGQVLEIDLTSGRTQRLPIGEAVLRRFLGGSGLGTYLLLARGAAALDPLSPAAPMCFVFSPLVGSPLTTSAKFAVVSKSPLTERINDSLVSSQFALSGKRCGCDALVLVGRATAPSIVIVDDGIARLEPAGELWGMICREAEAALRRRLGSDYAVAAIGPAGERQVRYATVSHDGRHAGRGGSGAVLGAKNIKAIAVRGTQRAPLARPAELVALAKDLSQKSFGPATAKYRELGTAANLLVFNRLNALPTRNFQQGSFAGAGELAPEQLEVTRAKARASCAACTIGCEHLYGLRGADGAAAGNVRVEYESLFALGPLCGVDDSDAVLRASQRCDELGLDTISAGGTIAFAMECASRGMLDAPWLRFGDGDALLRAIDLVGTRDGLGDLLAEGSRRAAWRIGQGSIDFAPQVKGLEIPGYEPRALQTMALGFAVGTRGADHNRSGAYEVDFSEHVDRRDPGVAAAALAVETEDRAALIDSLILCKFLRGAFTDFFAEASHMLNLVTGWDTTSDELRKTARRIVAAKKLFNIRAGWTPDEDTLPARFFAESLPEDDRAHLSREKLAAMIRAYHAARGWSAEGYPRADQLAELPAVHSSARTDRTSFPERRAGDRCRPSTES